ncbi:glycosyltransferase family 4 protein [Bacillus sp. S3]|uniref:glycosyltransferase n=1 Tax=Bacillus sp. S3 TaxID=486398 RepID=UPI0011881074|nr:glycosyltransferase [Bacillus sp. S3]QCJ44760.1 glycosyltransferase family 4 protein [Bacillus sp. S3]
MISKNNINIIFVTGYMANGGAERVISVIANGLVNKGYSVSILAILGDKQDYEISKRVNYIPFIENSNNQLIRVIKRLMFIRGHINKSKHTIVISFMAQINVYAIVANFFNNAKLIVSERNDPNQDPNSKMLRGIRDFLYNFVKGIVFQTPDAQKYFSKKIQGKSFLIPNPLSEKLPKPFIGKRRKVIVTATRLSEQKNLKLLLDSFYKIQLEFPEYILEIYGEGPLKEELISYSDELNIKDKVVFKGFSRNLHEDILDASIFVLPSNYEGISNSLIEALALGIPVISTDHPIGGAKMYIKPDNNGLLVPIRDTEALYLAMKKIIDNPSLGNMYSENAVKIRSELEIEKIISKWESCIFNETRN